MTLYIIGIIFFIIVIITCIFVLIYLIKDEKKPREVSSDALIQFGKTYTKEEFEQELFNQYIGIIQGPQYKNYDFLKDAVSDQYYNKMLLQIKDNQDKKQEQVISNINLDFSKLIGLYTENELEIAKLWIRYSSIEYIKGWEQVVDETGIERNQEIIKSGDSEKNIYHERILTFVKNKSEKEDIVCPSCGYQTHILKSSKCIRCESEIVPKTMHWVFVDSIETNISKN